MAHFLEQAAAQAARARAQAEFSRAEQAWRRGSARTTALVAEAKAELEEARLNLEWTRNYAPANGYVTFVQLREGFYVHAGEPVLTFIDADQWWVVANYRENSLEHIRPGQRVGLTFNTYPRRIFPGVVQTVSWGVNQGQGKPSGNLPAVSEPPNWIRLAHASRCGSSRAAGRTSHPGRDHGQCGRVHPGEILAQRGDRNLAEDRGLLGLPILRAR